MSSLNVLYSIRVHAKETVPLRDVSAEVQRNSAQATHVDAAFHARIERRLEFKCGNLCLQQITFKAHFAITNFF